jgi:hypothetical protein
LKILTAFWALEADHVRVDIRHRNLGSQSFILLPYVVRDANGPAVACAYTPREYDLFVVQVVACAASFYAHVFFDKEYHVEGSRLQRFAWFRRKQELHFVHHRHANCHFAVIHFFWDRILRLGSIFDRGMFRWMASRLLISHPGA